MDFTPERQPLQEITSGNEVQQGAPSTPADAIVQRLMARIRELEHRLFDPDGILGERFTVPVYTSHHQKTRSRIVAGFLSHLYFKMRDDFCRQSPCTTVCILIMLFQAPEIKEMVLWLG